MQKDYQEAADKLEGAVEEAISSLRTQMAGLNIDKIAKESMAVEVVSFLLAKCLSDERLAFDFDDRQQAHKEAMHIIKAAVIQYRRQNICSGYWSPKL
ncbi:hypothetical protein PN36_12490 [Candidatus Thiomargarita nelsonii]|uniref:Uncharacterized protein n=1 Tax=Candidatus Thiomargarita nelsonii TaxID=1003181 RepID=A0A0A6RWS5_9GAMM|nr:hypothetical protein PN36_12490 [Candidatus Thiomargarita nelsonii]